MWPSTYLQYIHKYLWKSLEIFNYVYWTKLQVSPYLDVIGSSIYKVEFHLNVQKVEIKCSIFKIKRVTWLCIGQKSLPLIRLNLFTITNTPSFSWLDKAYRFHCCTWSWLNETLFKFAYFFALYLCSLLFETINFMLNIYLCYIHPNLYMKSISILAHIGILRRPQNFAKSPPYFCPM